MACLLRGQDRPDQPVPSSLSLEVTARDQGQTWVLRLAGDLDISNKDQLRAAIASTLALRPQVLVLDLSAVDYADCSSLSVMVWAHHALASDQRQLSVAGSRGIVRRLMKVTGIDKALRLVDSFPPASAQPPPDLPAPLC